MRDNLFHNLGFNDIKPGNLLFEKYEKLYPLTVSFFELYGGDNEDYQFLREFAEVLKNTNVEIGETNDPYIDVSSENGIRINSEFLDFLFHTGRKKIFMSFMAGAVNKLSGESRNTKNLEFLLVGGKRSLVNEGETRLDDAKRLFQLQEKVKANNIEFKQADITQSWDLENHSFDLISCNLVLEHIENLNFIFQQAAQKLQSKGLFFICELHPYKQYNGSKARIVSSNGVEEILEVYTHHLSDFTQGAKDNGFQLSEMQEWFDDNNRNNTPRLISFLFQNA